MKQSLVLVSLATACSVIASEPDLSKLPAPSAQKGVTYAKDIKPILQASCLRCHGERQQKAGLRLDSLEAVLKGSEDGKVLNPGQSAKSKLVVAVSQLDPELSMPPKGRGGRGGPGGPGGARGTNAAAGGPGQRPGGPGNPGGPGGNFQPPKPLTPEQVGLVRAWIDQGAK